MPLKPMTFKEVYGNTEQPKVGIGESIVQPSVGLTPMSFEDVYDKEVEPADSKLLIPADPDDVPSSPDPDAYDYMNMWVDTNITKEGSADAGYADPSQQVIDPTAQSRSEIMRVLGSYGTLIQQPVGILEGAAEFITAIPGFLVGVGEAVQNISQQVLATGGDLEDIYKAAERGMQSGTEKVDYLQYKPNIPEASIIGETVMAPMMLPMKIVHVLADDKSFDNSPNIRGAMKFVGDIGAMLAFGRMTHVKGGRLEAAKKAGRVVNKAKEIYDQEVILKDIPESPIKILAQKELELQKFHLEKEAELIKNDISGEKVAKTQTSITADKVKKAKKTAVIDIKTKGPVTEVKRLVDEADMIDPKYATKKQFTYLKAYAANLESKGKSLKEEFNKGDLSALSETSQVGIEWAKDKTVTKTLEKEMMEFAKEHNIILGKGEGPVMALHGKVPRPDLKIVAKSKEPVVELAKERAERRSLLAEGQKIDIADLDLIKYDRSSLEAEFKVLDDIKDPDMSVVTPWVQKIIDSARASKDLTDVEYKKLASRAREYGAETMPRLKFKPGEDVTVTFSDIEESRLKVVKEGEMPIEPDIIEFSRITRIAGKVKGKKLPLYKIKSLGKQVKNLFDVGDKKGLSVDQIKKFFSKRDELDAGIADLYKESGNDLKYIEEQIGSDLFRFLDDTLNILGESTFSDFKGTEFYDTMVGKHRGRSIRLVSEVKPPAKKPSLGRPTDEQLALQPDSALEIMQEVWDISDLDMARIKKLKTTAKPKEIVEKVRAELDAKREMAVVDETSPFDRTDPKLYERQLRNASDEALTAELSDYERMFTEDPKLSGKAAERAAQAAAEYDRRFPPAEVDEFIGVSEGITPETLNDPFLKSIKETSRDAKLYEGLKLDNPDTFMAKLTNDVNRWYHGEDLPIADIREGLTKLATDVEQLWHLFPKPTDFANFKEVIHETAAWARDLKRPTGEPKSYVQNLNEAAQKAHSLTKDFTESWAKAFESLKNEEGSIGPRERKIITRALEDVKQSSKDSRAAIKETIPAKAKRVFKIAKHTWWDRSGNIAGEILNTLDTVGYKIVQAMDVAAGGPARAAQQMHQMRKEVYKGLDKNARRILDDVIFHNRMIQIGEVNKTKKTSARMVFPKGTDPISSRLYLDTLSATERITPELAATIQTRATGYFDWMKRTLKDLYEEDIISKKTYDNLKDFDYMRLQLAEILEPRYLKKLKAAKKGSEKSGVDPLARGLKEDLFERNTELLALDRMNLAYRKIYNNRANKTLLDLAENSPDNPFVRIKGKGKKIPKGWQKTSVMKEGKKQELWLNELMSKEWLLDNPEISYGLANQIRFWSGSSFLRSMATGINLGFALANLPRDIAHIYLTSQIMEKGEWKSTYSPILPEFVGQIGHDMASVASDAFMRRGRFLSYIKEGGGMELMTTQGRFWKKGRHIETRADKIQNFLGYLGTTTELWTRLALRERVARTRARQKGITLEEAYKDPEISREATWAARNYMDFAQGGTYAKAVDSGIPFFNAAIQGARGIWRSAIKNPAEFGAKVAQIQSVFVGMHLANQQMSPKTMASISESDSKNNFIIALPDKMGFTDREGQWHGVYMKIPLDQGLRFFKLAAEAGIDKTMGKEIDVAGVIKSLAEFSPVDDISRVLPPTAAAMLGYYTNKDFWRNEDIWKGSKPLPFGQSQAEVRPGRTPQAMQDIGQLTGASPERLNYALSQWATRGNIYTYAAGKLYNKLVDVPDEMANQPFIMTMAQYPIAKRFIGVTHSYTKHVKGIEKIENKALFDKLIPDTKFDQLVNGHLFAKTVKREEITKFIVSQKDRNERKRYKELYRFALKTKDLPERSFWNKLRRLPIKPRAKVYKERWSAADATTRQQIISEMGIVRRAGGVLTADFKRELRKLTVTEK